MDKFKKMYTLLVGVLISVLIIQSLFYIKQINKYKHDIGYYDLGTFSMIEEELETLIYLEDQNELTQERYVEIKESLSDQFLVLSKSPVCGSMFDELDEFMDPRDNNEFKNKMKLCRSFQKELERLTRKLSKNKNTYDYFNDESNREALLSLLDEK